MNTSLSKFCKDTNLPKSSVYVRCQELNFDTSSGLTPEMVAQLEHEFGVAAPKAEPATETPLSATTVVDVGNHKIVLGTPQFPQSYAQKWCMS